MRAAQWDHIDHDAVNDAAADSDQKPGNRLEDVTSRLNDLARSLAPEPEEDEIVEEHDDQFQARADYEAMIADLARRTQESEDRIASALEVLTNVLAQSQKAPAQPHHIEVQKARPEGSFPPPPPPAPSRDDHVSRFEERLARLTSKILPTRAEPLVLDNPEVAEFAAVVETARQQPTPAGAIKATGLTFVPYVAPSRATAPAAERAAPPQMRLKDVVSEINARQRELLEDASKDNSSRVRALEDRLEAIAAQMQHVSIAGQAQNAGMSSLNNAVEALARRTSVPLAGASSPDMLDAINRSLADLSRRFEGTHTDVSAATLEELRGSIESLTARLDNARPGEETKAVLGTIQRSIEHLAVRLDQAVQAPSTREALVAMQGAIQGIGEQINRIGTIAGRSEKLSSLENTIEDLISELRSAGREPVFVPEVENLTKSISSLTRRLDTAPPVQAATNEALWSVERAIVDLSSKLDSKAAPANDPGALHTIQDAIENLADRIERNGASDNAYEANIAIRSALESFAKRQELSDQRIEKLASLEGTVTRLAQLVESSQGMSMQAAQDAASSAVREALSDLPDILGTDNARLNSLSRTLDTLQSQSEKAERRTVDAFESVRSTLERIIVRLANDEVVASNGKAPAAAEPMDPTAAARAAARRAMAESQAIAPAAEPLTDMGEARSKRARFIAAARRATTPSMPEAVNDDDIDHDHLAQGSGVNWKGRRVAAIGLAGLLLVLGSFQFGKLALQNDPSQSAQKAADEKQQVAAAATPAPARETVRAEPAAAPTISDDLKVAAASPADPVVTGSIPSQMDLPAEIGGPTLIESARRSDPAALHEIAIRYFDGDRVAQDQTKAIEWFQKSAELGFAPAQFRLGNAFDKGHGTTANPGTAEAWYRKAADQGHIKAMHNLAVLLAEGSLGKPDYSQAAYWFRRAADRGVRDSQYNLGVMLARGLGVNQDMAEAYKWFAVAANAGDSDSSTKRDQVAAKLKPATLVAARLEAQTWQPLPKDGLANDENAPNGGWDGPGKTS